MRGNPSLQEVLSMLSGKGRCPEFRMLSSVQNVIHGTMGDNLDSSCALCSATKVGHRHAISLPRMEAASKYQNLGFILSYFSCLMRSISFVKLLKVDKSLAHLIINPFLINGFLSYYISNCFHATEKCNHITTFQIALAK